MQALHNLDPGLTPPQLPQHLKERIDGVLGSAGGHVQRIILWKVPLGHSAGEAIEEGELPLHGSRELFDLRAVQRLRVHARTLGSAAESDKGWTEVRFSANNLK